MGSGRKGANASHAVSRGDLPGHLIALPPRLVDVAKPGVLRGVFAPFHGQVELARDGATATVTFPDAREMQLALNRVGGGTKGAFLVQPRSRTRLSASVAASATSATAAPAPRGGAPPVVAAAAGGQRDPGGAPPDRTGPAIYGAAWRVAPCGGEADAAGGASAAARAAAAPLSGPRVATGKTASAAASAWSTTPSLNRFAGLLGDGVDGM